MRASVLIISVFVLGAAACGDSMTADGEPGSGEPIGGGPYPVADLSIEITHPDAEVDLRYQVVCLGDTATLSGDEVAVDAQDACLTLADPDAVDRLVNGAPDDRVCTEQYGGPDLARIVGTIDDEAVDATIDRANGCGISDWDQLLAGLLPPAVGVVG